MRKINLGDVLLKVFNCIFITALIYIIYLNLFFKEGNYYNFNTIVVIIGAAIEFLILYGLNKVFKNCNNKLLYIISLLSFTILIILQVVFITYLKVEPSWDFGQIFNDSYEAATGVFELKEYYYKLYPNNIGILLFFTVIFKVVNLFTINKDVYLLVGMIVNIIMINGSLLAMYILIKKVFNLKCATLFSVFCLFSVPLFTYAPIFYTDTITMIFPVLMLWLLYMYINSKNNNRFLYLVFIGLVGGVGTILKTNIVIVLVAIIIYLTCTNRIVKGVGKNLIIILSFFIIFKAYNTVAQSLMPIDYNEAGIPPTHWVMMGLNGVGGYNQEDVEYTTSFTTKEEMKDANIEMIKSRLNNYGVKGYLRFLNVKVNFTWSDGTYYSINKLVRKPLGNTEDSLHKAIIGENNEYFVYYAQFSHLLMLIMILMSSIRVFKSNNKNRFIQCSHIIIFGVFLFLILWEARSRYLVCILPVMMFSAIGGLNYLGEGRN